MNPCKLSYYGKNVAKATKNNQCSLVKVCSENLSHDCLKRFATLCNRQNAVCTVFFCKHVYSQ